MPHPHSLPSLPTANLTAIFPISPTQAAAIAAASLIATSPATVAASTYCRGLPTVSPPVTIVRSSLAIAAASNDTLCHYHSLLSLLPLLPLLDPYPIIAATAAPLRRPPLFLPATVTDHHLLPSLLPIIATIINTITAAPCLTLLISSSPLTATIARSLIQPLSSSTAPHQSRPQQPSLSSSSSYNHLHLAAAFSNILLLSHSQVVAAILPQSTQPQLHSPLQQPLPLLAIASYPIAVASHYNTQPSSATVLS
ncbi:hypothetical protein BHM03_00061494 [Ensete ventricosum]|nr:hypothetical protein BHM03_00061494 [Ensete ventricosum]